MNQGAAADPTNDMPGQGTAVDSNETEPEQLYLIKENKPVEEAKGNSQHTLSYHLHIFLSPFYLLLTLSSNLSIFLSLCPVTFLLTLPCHLSIFLSLCPVTFLLTLSCHLSIFHSLCPVTFLLTLSSHLSIFPSLNVSAFIFLLLSRIA